MRAVDTNILVAALVSSAANHDTAYELVRRLAEGAIPWAVPWPCIYELVRVVTHPRIFHPPMPLDRVRRDVTALCGSPSLMLLTHTPRHREILDAVLAESGATGNLVHDAHIVALCREHGVSEILTADRDFHRFRGLTVTNPFTGAA